MKINCEVALITGGSKGIGFGIAEALVKKNVKVAFTNRNAEAANKAVEVLSKIPGAEVMGIEADVRNKVAQENAVKQVIDRWGKLDLLVANAGVGHFASIDTMTHEQWNETIETNLTGVFNSVKASVEELKKSKGYIITISSLAGTNFFPGGAAYNASKFGLTGFSQAIMLDLRRHGIRVTTIMPGSVSTYFSNQSPGNADSWKIQIEDIGQVVVDLMEMNPRTLPSKIEIRPSLPPGA